MSVDVAEQVIRERARELVCDVGPKKAAFLLGLSRSALLSLAAGAPVTRGTFAVVREHLRARGRHQLDERLYEGVSPQRAQRRKRVGEAGLADGNAGDPSVPPRTQPVRPKRGCRASASPAPHGGTDGP